MSNDHDRALALANRIAAAWGLEPLALPDGCPYADCWTSENGSTRIDYIGQCPWYGVGLCTGYDTRPLSLLWVRLCLDGSGDPIRTGDPSHNGRRETARRLYQTADIATDGLISHRLRQAGETDWLAWLWPETSDENCSQN